MKIIKNFKEFVNENIQEEDQPQYDDDCFVTSNGNELSVCCGGKFLGKFIEDEDAYVAVKKWKEENKFYPNTWYVSDHGNISLVDDDGNFIKK